MPESKVYGPPPPAPKITEIVPTSRNQGVQWRYTRDKPAEDWFKPGFNASLWKEGLAGFGTTNTPD